MPHSLLKAGDTMVSSEVFTFPDVQWTINSQIRKCRSVPNKREQNKAGCGGWTAWGRSGWIAILFEVLDVLLIRYLKEVWEQGSKISG